MKRLLTLSLLTLFILSCSKKEDYFYVTNYPVTEVEVRFTLSEQADEALIATVEQLAEEVKQTAPVQAGGGYRLLFNRYNGGVLEVWQQEAGELITGSFTKVPASSQLTFTYGEQEYTAHLNGYTNEQGEFCTFFEVDLTAQYRELHHITDTNFSLVRLERTSHLYD